MIVTKLLADAEVLRFEEPFYTHHVITLDEVGESASGVPYVMSFLPSFLAAQLNGKISVVLEPGDPGTAGSVPQVGDPHTWLATQTFNTGIEVDSIADLSSVERISLSGDTILSDDGGIERLRLTTLGAVVSGDFSVTGNMTVAGTTTRIDSTVVDIADRIIHVNNSTGANDPVPLLPTGISVHRGAVASVDRDHAGMFWDETASRFKFALNTGGDDSTLGAFLDVQALVFYGSGAGLTALNATNISSGTLADARLSSNIPLKNASVSWSGSVHVWSAATSLEFTGREAAGVLFLTSGVLDTSVNLTYLKSVNTFTFGSTGAGLNAILEVGNGTANIGIIRIKGVTSLAKQLIFTTGSLNRWNVNSDSVAESGGNAGSNFVISRYTDAGGFIASALSIVRSTGVVTCNGGGITALNASNISTGTLSDARLSADVPLLSAVSQTFTGDMTVDGKLTVGGAIDPTQVLLSGGDKRFGATDAGSVYLAPFSDSANAVEIRKADNTTVLFSVDSSTGDIAIMMSFVFSDTGMAPTIAGQLCRQGNYLHYHDGTSAMFMAVTGVENTFTAQQRFEQPIRVEDFEDLNNVAYASYDNTTFIFTFSEKVALTKEGDCVLDLQCTTASSNFTGICFTHDAVQKYEFYYDGASNEMRLYGNDLATDLFRVDSGGNAFVYSNFTASGAVGAYQVNTDYIIPTVSGTLEVTGNLNVNTGFIEVSGTQVVTSRETGWTAATGTATKGGFDTTLVSLLTLSQSVKAIIDALIYHGLLGT